MRGKRSRHVRWRACDEHCNFAGLDLKGKVAVLITGSPSNVPGALSAHSQSLRERWNGLKAAGAIGYISIPNPAFLDLPWSRIALNRTHPSMDLDYPEFNETPGAQLYVMFNPDRAEMLFKGSGHTFQELADLGKNSQTTANLPTTCVDSVQSACGNKIFDVSQSGGQAAGHGPCVKG